MDVEKTMEFLLDHHAKFAADIELMREETNRQMAEHAQRLVHHDRALADLDERLGYVTDLVGRVAQASLILTERLDAQAGRLDALIVVVEKYLSRNGGQHHGLA